jgi:AcrR family transcriptional regulator
MGRQKSQDNRDRILDIAITLFAERGVRGVSTREITDAADLTKPMLYYYFKDKQGLITAILDIHMNELYEAIEEVTAGDRSVEECLREFVRVRFRQVMARPDVMRFQFAFYNGPDLALVPDEYQEQHSRINAVVSDLIQKGCETGIFRPDLLPNIAATVFEGAYKELIRSYLLRGRPELTDENADAVVETVLRGLRNTV